MTQTQAEKPKILHNWRNPFQKELLGSLPLMRQSKWISTNTSRRAWGRVQKLRSRKIPCHQDPKARQFLDWGSVIGTKSIQSISTSVIVTPRTSDSPMNSSPRSRPRISSWNGQWTLSDLCPPPQADYSSFWLWLTTCPNRSRRVPSYW